MKKEIKLPSNEIAEFLGLPHFGCTISVTSPANIAASTPASFKFATGFSQERVELLNKNSSSYALVHADFKGKLTIPHSISLNPRLDFCQVLNNFFRKESMSGIEKSARMGKDVIMGSNVYIGVNTVVGDNVVIGDNTVISHNVIISDETEIGSNCFIKSGTVIGQKGFGFARDLNGTPVEFVHYGHVKIGDRVEIGALNTIARGVLDDTIIENDVKTDDHVHIAHNVCVGPKTLIAAGAVIGGSANIKSQTWLGLNATMIDGKEIGDFVTVGMGAAVIRSVESNTTVVGNPARPITRK